MMLTHHRKQLAAMFTKHTARFARDEGGAALVEYGLLVGLIAVVCIGAVKTLGVTINGFFGTINTTLAG